MSKPIVTFGCITPPTFQLVKIPALFFLLSELRKNTVISNYLRLELSEDFLDWSCKSKALGIIPGAPLVANPCTRWSDWRTPSSAGRYYKINDHIMDNDVWK